MRVQAASLCNVAQSLARTVLRRTSRGSSEGRAAATAWRYSRAHPSPSLCLAVAILVAGCGNGSVEPVLPNLGGSWTAAGVGRTWTAELTEADDGQLAGSGTHFWLDSTKYVVSGERLGSRITLRFIDEDREPSELFARVYWDLNYVAADTMVGGGSWHSPTASDFRITWLRREP